MTGVHVPEAQEDSVDRVRHPILWKRI